MSNLFLSSSPCMNCRYFGNTLTLFFSLTLLHKILLYLCCRYCFFSTFFNTHILIQHHRALIFSCLALLISASLVKYKSLLYLTLLYPQILIFLTAILILSDIYTVLHPYSVLIGKRINFCDVVV